MEVPSIFLEQIAFITRPKTEEHMLNDMDKSTHEEHLSQPFNLVINNLKLQSHSYLVIRDSSMLQIQIIGSIS